MTASAALEEKHPLQITNAEVACLSRSQRESRLDALMDRSLEIYEAGIAKHSDGHSITGRVIQFSGGNDSTTLAHLFRFRATHAAHANTTIGIEETRQYVRDTCAGWKLPLLEKWPKPGEAYEDFVLGRVTARQRGTGKIIRLPGGFPGPGNHSLMYQRLKERQFNQVRRDLVSHPRRERIVLIAGRRRDESARRRKILHDERRGSAIWVSPLVEWTKLDLNTYRLRFGDVPRNRVSDLLHMSGECLCGCFAKENELEQIEHWFPGVASWVHWLEREIADREDINPRYKKWGWYKNPGGMCESCNT